MKTIYVKCSVIVPVEVEDTDFDDEGEMRFYFEENHCPATGMVDSALSEIIREHAKRSTCWACALGGECEIVKVVPANV